MLSLASRVSMRPASLAAAAIADSRFLFFIVPMMSFLNVERMLAGSQSSQLVLVASVLAPMALAHLILRWWIRRKARQVQQPPADATPDTRRLRRWLTRGLTEILPPLALLIWIHGLYLLASLLLRHAA